MGQYAVIGLGNFGFHLTRALFEGGNEVVALDQDKNLVQSTAPFCTQSMVLDATDKENLRNLGMDTMDGVIVSVGSNLSSSILITLHLHEIGVQRIIVKAIDEDHAKILDKIGASEVIHPEKEMALRLAKSLTHPNILDYFPLSDNFEIVQISPPREFCGRNLRDLDLRVKYDIQVIAVKETQPNQNTLIPPSTYVIKESDTLIIIGEEKHINKIRGLKGGK